MISSSGFGVNGNTLTISGLSPYSITWGNFSGSYSANPSLLNNITGYCGPFPNAGVAGTTIKQITLPNNQSYQFSYENNPYGMLSKIQHPTGATVEYNWGLNGPAEAAVFEDQKGAVDACWWQYSVPVVTQRTVKFDGVNPALTQSFQYQTYWSSDVRYWRPGAL